MHVVLSECVENGREMNVFAEKMLMCAACLLYV